MMMSFIFINSITLISILLLLTSSTQQTQAVLDPWNDPNCSAAQCHNHGTCDNVSLSCECNPAPSPYVNVTQWVGPRCDRCRVGFAGPNCNIECKGGYKNPCNGHGICRGRSTGDGSCDCFSDSFYGHWTGETCDRCLSYAFGASCNVTCPGVAQGYPSCYGRGVCSTVTGKCACEGGFGTGTGCRDCNSSSFGVGCLKRCDGFQTETGLACSGHGTCFSGLAANGTCQCGSNYAGADCSKQCPNSCSGHGACSDGTTGTAECACEGNFAPPDCLQCRSNVTGPNCTIACPTGNGGLMCSGRGSCLFEANTSSAKCVCDLGYSGTACTTACPGSPPCSGHGECGGSSSSPTCTCFANETHGFWTGTSCDRCNISYNNSQSCTQLCPVDLGGVVCGGHGWCGEGRCYCDRTNSMDYCDIACNTSSTPAPQIEGQACTGCGCELCVVPGTFGSSCGSTCPGNLQCSSHGYCDEGKNGTGMCACVFGYAKDDCSTQCPLSVSNGQPCGGIGRGDCITHFGQAVCQCHIGFAGPACEVECPRFGGAECSHNGLCNRTTGTCQCASGWTGAACNIICSCDVTHGKCNSTLCDAKIGTSSASCFECLCNGNFTGLCDQCAPGHQGENCDSPCVNGNTTGRSCVCEQYFSSSSCAVPCPKNETTGSICTGHGTCDWGATRPGTCNCIGDWYGASCDVKCSGNICLNSFGLRNSQCAPATGSCECLNDGTRGYVGEKCDVCAEGFWGPTCGEACFCSGHGACKVDTGECVCQYSASTGYFSGLKCEQCADGFIGDFCKRRNIGLDLAARAVIISSGRNLTSVRSFMRSVAPAVLHIGGSPLIRLESKPAGDVNETGAVFKFPNLIGSSTTTTFATTSSTTTTTSSTTSTTSTTTSTTTSSTTTSTTTTTAPSTGATTTSSIITSPTAATMSTTSETSTSTSSSSPASTSPSSSSPAPQKQQICFPDVAISWQDEKTGKTLAILQPCDNEQDITIWSADYGTNSWKIETDRFKLDVGKPGLKIILASVVKAGAGNSEALYVSIIVAEPIVNSTVTQRQEILGRFKPGGTIYRISITVALGQNPRQPSFRALPSTFTPLALDTFTDLDVAESEIIAVGGHHTASQTHPQKWDLLLLQEKTGQLKSFEQSPDDDPSILEMLKCWPAPVATSSVQFCRNCGEITHLEFGLKGSLFVTMSDPEGGLFAAWIQPRRALVNNQNVMQTTRSTGRCKMGTYDLSLGQVVFPDGEAVLPEYAVEVARPIPPTQTQVTSIAVDKFGSLLLVALRQLDPNAPGFLCKFFASAGNFRIEGVNELTLIAVEGTAVPQTVDVMAVDSSQRIIYALISNTTQVRLLSFLAYEVHGVVPDLADIRGGTNVTVQGLGFLTQPGFQPTCSFGGTQSVPVPATILNPTTLYCLAPEQVNNSAAGACSGQTVEVSLYSTTWMSQNGFTIQRVQAARIEGKVSPDRGSLSGRVNITIRGQGFQPSNYAKCKFFSNNSLATEVLYSDLRYIDTTTAQCDQPPAQYASFDTSFIDVSLDGQLYSDGAPARYEVVGSPMNLSSSFYLTSRAIDANSVFIANNSAFRIDIVVPVVVIDERLHRLENLDSARRTICFEANSSGECSPSFFSFREGNDGYPWPPCRPMRFTVQDADPGLLTINRQCKHMTEGRINFVLRVENATSGPFSLRFTTQLGPELTWITQTSLVISNGKPFALALFNKKTIEQRPLIIQSQAFSPAPEIAVLDKLGNVLPSLAELPAAFTLTAQAYYELDSEPGVRIYTDRYPLPKPDAAQFRFATIFLTQYIHGANHYIEFTSQSPVLLPISSPALRTSPCENGNSSFKLPNSSKCLPCPPEGAVCDGSELIQVLPGYWNGSTTGDIFKCPGGKFICLGSGLARPCEFGYTGPLCANCIDKWGKSGTYQCAECPPTATSAVFIGGGFVIIIIALFIWSFITLRQAEVTDLSVIFRTVVNHLQAAGKITDMTTELNPIINALFNAQDAASSPSFSGLSSLDCLVREAGSDYEALFYLYMSLPVISILTALISYCIIALMNLKPVITKKLYDDIQEDIKNMPNPTSAVFLDRYPFYVVATTSFSVVLFTIYQTLVDQSTAVLRCTEVVYNGTVQSFLDVDMRIPCDSAGNHKLRTAAYVFAIVYGFGVPGMFLFGYKFFERRVGNQEITKLMFQFLIGGYKDQYWHWQAIIMVRKMFLVIFNVVLNDPLDIEVNGYVGMWQTAIALILQLYFSPNTKKDHNTVEAMSLAVITATLNLGLIYPYLDTDLKLAVTILLVVMTAGCFIMFGVFMYQPLKETIEEILVDVKAVTGEVTSKLQVLIDKEGGGKKRIDWDDPEMNRHELRDEYIDDYVNDSDEDEIEEYVRNVEVETEDEDGNKIMVLRQQSYRRKRPKINMRNYVAEVISGRKGGGRKGGNKTNGRPSATSAATAAAGGGGGGGGPTHTRFTPSLQGSEYFDGDDEGATSRYDDDGNYIGDRPLFDEYENRHSKKSAAEEAEEERRRKKKALKHPFAYKKKSARALRAIWGDEEEDDTELITQQNQEEKWKYQTNDTTLAAAQMTADINSDEEDIRDEMLKQAREEEFKKNYKYL